MTFPQTATLFSALAHCSNQWVRLPPTPVAVLARDIPVLVARHRPPCTVARKPRLFAHHQLPAPVPLTAKLPQPPPSRLHSDPWSEKERPGAAIPHPPQSSRNTD